MGKLGFGYHYAGECDAMARTSNHRAYFGRSKLHLGRMVGLAQRSSRGHLHASVLAGVPLATENSFAEVQSNDIMRLNYIVNTRKWDDH
jgi:hypothetical protein